MPPLLHTCPYCHTSRPLVEGIEDAGFREALVAALALRLDAARVLRYLDLFARPGGEVKPGKAAKVLGDLVERVRVGQVTRNGIAYAAPLEAWEIAIQATLDSGTKTLPLKSNGYLVSTLCNLAESAVAKAEARREEELRQPRMRETVEVAGGMRKAGSFAFQQPPPPAQVNKAAGAEAVAAALAKTRGPRAETQ